MNCKQRNEEIHRAIESWKSESFQPFNFFLFRTMCPETEIIFHTLRYQPTRPKLRTGIRVLCYLGKNERRKITGGYSSDRVNYTSLAHGHTDPT